MNGISINHAIFTHSAIHNPLRTLIHTYINASKMLLRVKLKDINNGFYIFIMNGMHLSAQANDPSHSQPTQ